MALIKCPECGHDVSDSAAACPYCGRPVQNFPAKSVAAETPSTKKRFPVWIIPVVLVVCVFAGGLLYYMENHRFPWTKPSETVVEAVASEEKAVQFELSGGVVIIPDEAQIQNQFLTDEQKQIIDAALRKTVEICNALYFMPKDARVDMQTFGAEAMELSDSAALKSISEADPALEGRTPDYPLRVVMSCVAIALLQGIGDFTTANFYVEIAQADRNAIRTAVLSALEYYYNSNAEPYLSN